MHCAGVPGQGGLLSGVPGPGVSAPEGFCSRGVSAPGGAWSGRGIPACTEADPTVNTHPTESLAPNFFFGR